MPRPQASSKRSCQHSVPVLYSHDLAYIRLELPRTYRDGHVPSLAVISKEQVTSTIRHIDLFFWEFKTRSCGLHTGSCVDCCTDRRSLRLRAELGRQTCGPIQACFWLPSAFVHDDFGSKDNLARKLPYSQTHRPYMFH